MDKQLEILLNSKQNIATVNVDSYDKVALSNTLSEINEYDIRNAISATEVFDAERDANPVYRIYGRLEYMSLLNGLKNTYSRFSDFFNPQKSGNTKNIFNSFDFYLVRAAESGYTHLTGGSSNILWARYFKVISKPINFELFPIGFANNVYGEQAYSFNFNVDFDVSSYVDNFGFPATELFLYAQYKNSSTPTETLSFTKWNNLGVSGKTTFTTTSLNVGDYIKTTMGEKIGDLIEYSKTEFLQEQLSPQTFYIRTPYTTPTSSYLIWKYNPLIPLRLRYFTSNLYEANTGDTSYELVNSIPLYATPIGAGNFVWRNIMKQGYIDPLTGVGVDYPFMNRKRYLFAPIVFDVTPDLNDAVTRIAFEEVWFEINSKKLSTTSTGDINNIGKPCR